MMLNQEWALLAVFDRFARPVPYTRGASMSLVRAYARGLRADELAAAADQFDRYIVVKASELVAGGFEAPRKFDRINLFDGVFVVFDWRPSPAMGAPLFFKLMVKGGAP
jgi:hypothetical protein